MHNHKICIFHILKSVKDDFVMKKKTIFAATNIKEGYYIINI
ncbi:hypothetical protein HMPREF9420_2024 [Segatella salivae DSM 15606]|jgi:hypothetical protein|uniref:Uncharacterized protein n=1 Tax=Segatella salivae DSM 15606 TaxID=888832 RepID=E6MRA6_9BACT|nr:hypothetical protein HMPREF9420_2024 [Segatella salivae DSM 15606]